MALGEIKTSKSVIGKNKKRNVGELNSIYKILIIQNSKGQR